MIATLLAQGGLAHQIGWWVIVLVVIAAIVGVGLVVARAAGINVPPWFLTILWIVLAAVVGVLAIKVLLSLL